MLTCSSLFASKISHTWKFIPPNFLIYYYVIILSCNEQLEDLGLDDLKNFLPSIKKI